MCEIRVRIGKARDTITTTRIEFSNHRVVVSKTQVIVKQTRVVISPLISRCCLMACSSALPVAVRACTSALQCTCSFCTKAMTASVAVRSAASALKPSQPLWLSAHAHQPLCMCSLLDSGCKGARCLCAKAITRLARPPACRLQRR